MNDAPVQPACPRCGAPIPPDAPRGVCPRCLLADVATPSDAGQRNPRRLQPPPLAEVAAAFPDLEIAGIVGVGGMGVVYKARQPRLDRWVALKVLPPSLGSDPAFVERFNREARFLARLARPNIVSVHDVGQAGGFCYLLMEFVDGVNLRQAMRAGRFSPAGALALVPRICGALQYAHERGVLHRDIKPENILIDAAGNVKIADFGVAKLVGEDPGDITLTVAGARLGTPHYMAPEQVEKPADVDHRADIYSLGVVFYELLTGELPLGRFAAPSARAAIDARVDEIVMRALAKERELRQQSAGEVKTEVERLSTAATPPPAAAKPEPPAGGDGRWAGVRVVRTDRGGPVVDVGGVLLAWLAFLPVAAMGAFLATVFTHRWAGWPAVAVMAAVSVALALGTRRARAAFAAEPRATPPLPRAARVVAGGLAAAVALQCLPWLAHLKAPEPGQFSVRAVPDFPLLFAGIALWTRHRGWRKTASVFLGLVLFGGLAGSLVALVEPTVRSPHGPNPLLGLVSGLLVPVAFATLWHPRVRLAFGEKPDTWEKPVAIATPPAWRRRLAAVFLVLGAVLALAGIVNAIATKRTFEARVIFDVNDPQAFGRALGIPMPEAVLVHLPPQPGSAAWNRHPGGHLVLTRFGGSHLVHLASRSSDASEAAQFANEFAQELVGRVGSKVALVIDRAAVPPMPIRPNLPLSITLVILGTAIFVFPGLVLWLQSRARTTAELPRWADARTYDWLVRVAVGVMLVEALAAFALAIRPRIDAPPQPPGLVTSTQARLEIVQLPRQTTRHDLTLWSNGVAIPLTAFSGRLPPLAGKHARGWELQRSGPEHWTLSGAGVTAGFTLPDTVALRPNDAFMGPELSVGFGGRERRWLWVPESQPVPAPAEPDWGISIDVESDDRPAGAAEPGDTGPGRPGDSP